MATKSYRLAIQRASAAKPGRQVQLSLSVCHRPRCRQSMVPIIVAVPYRGERRLHIRDDRICATAPRRYWLSSPPCMTITARATPRAMPSSRCDDKPSLDTSISAWDEKLLTACALAAPGFLPWRAGMSLPKFVAGGQLHGFPRRAVDGATACPPRLLSTCRSALPA